MLLETWLNTSLRNGGGKRQKRILMQTLQSATWLCFTVYTWQHSDHDIWTASCVAFRGQASNNAVINVLLMKCCQALFCKVFYVPVILWTVLQTWKQALLVSIGSMLSGNSWIGFGWQILYPAACLFYGTLCLLYIIWVSSSQTHQEPVSCLICFCLSLLPFYSLKYILWICLV